MNTRRHRKKHGGTKSATVAPAPVAKPNTVVANPNTVAAAKPAGFNIGQALWEANMAKQNLLPKIAKSNEKFRSGVDRNTHKLHEKAAADAAKAEARRLKGIANAQAKAAAEAVRAEAKAAAEAARQIKRNQEDAKRHAKRMAQLAKQANLNAARLQRSEKAAIRHKEIEEHKTTARALANEYAQRIVNNHLQFKESHNLSNVWFRNLYQVSYSYYINSDILYLMDSIQKNIPLGIPDVKELWFIKQDMEVEPNFGPNSE
jgi:flagellar biosynthesis GTPase FlhF